MRFLCDEGAVVGHRRNFGSGKCRTRKRLAVVGAYPDMSVISFNDSPYRLKEEVLKLYDVAIEMAGRYP